MKKIFCSNRRRRKHLYAGNRDDAYGQLGPFSHQKPEII